MSTDTFEKTSLGWELSQLQQQVGEWLEYQSDRFQQNLPAWSFNWSVSPLLSSFLTFCSWLLLGLLLAWVVWRLWREFSPLVYSWLTGLSNSTVTSSQTNSNDLSVAVWWERSQEFYRQGNYREACRCLYLAILQHLHDTKVILHKPSRTDGEYLQLLHSSVTPMQPYETVITTHEQLCFSPTEIMSENYEQCQQAYREICEP